MSDVETVLIEHIRMIGEAEATQLREGTDQDTVDRYAEALQRGDRFPAVDLVPAGDGTFYIADGWHRVKAHQAIERGIVEAIIRPVVGNADPLKTALRYALRANTKHGLHLTRGDQRRRARAALLIEELRTLSLRQLENEIGVGKSTIGRVRQELIREQLIPDDAGEFVPDFVPDAYTTERGDDFGGDWELREEVFRLVAKLNALDPKDWRFIHGEDRTDGHRIIHDGLIEGQSVEIPLENNSVSEGMPVVYRVLPERAPRGLSQEERDRIEENRAKRAFFDARDRLMAHPDPKLRKAVATLVEYREAPGLWEDLRTFMLSGGPAEEHRAPDEENTDF